MPKVDRIYDLHTHTTASDGLLSPQQLLSKAVNNQVTHLAITDHDTTAALAVAHDFIREQQLPINLVNGVEISTLWQSNEIHIVGLHIDPNNIALQALLKQQERYRHERALSIAKKLEKVNVVNAYEQAKVLAQGDIVSRSHFARFLVDKGYSKDIKRAFKKYLSKSGYAYVPAKWATIEQAIAAIHQAGGYAILAHPSRYGLTLTKMRRLIAYFKQQQGDGMEVSQSRQAQADMDLLIKCANEYELLASQGSDFHGLDHYLDVGKTLPLPTSVKPIWYNWPL